MEAQIEQVTLFDGKEAQIERVTLSVEMEAPPESVTLIAEQDGLNERAMLFAAEAVLGVEGHLVSFPAGFPAGRFPAEPAPPLAPQ